MSGRNVKLSTAKILARVEQGIGWLTFNHPERRNAMSLDMWQGLGDAVELFESDPEVKVVVMLGAGGKAFVSGADISEFEQHRANAQQKEFYSKMASRGQTGIAQMQKPLIAMIDGYCIGGGLALALSADVRFATPGSQFGIPAAKLGLGYGYSGLGALARVVGPSTAKDLLFSARFLASEEALALGLINFVVEPSDLETQVRSYALRIAGNAPLTIHAAKEGIRLFERYSTQADSSAIANLVNQCFDSQDYLEGRRAFAEKRAPRFEGR